MFILDAIKKLDSINSRGDSNRYVMTNNNHIFCNVGCNHQSNMKVLNLRDFKESFLTKSIRNLYIQIYVCKYDYQINIKTLDTNNDIKKIRSI